MLFLTFSLDGMVGKSSNNKISRILLGRFSTRDGQRIRRNDENLIVVIFSPISLTWVYMGVKVSNDISPEITYQVHSPEVMYTSREGFYQICEKNCAFWIFNNLCFWRWAFNMVLNGELHVRNTVKKILVVLLWKGPKFDLRAQLPTVTVYRAHLIVFLK